MPSAFDNQSSVIVPVTVYEGKQKLVIGQATLHNSGDYIHVEMDLKTSDPHDVMELFGNGITGVSIAEETDNPNLRYPAGRHVDENSDITNFGFGRPANPLRRH